MTLLEDEFETRLRNSGLAVRSAFADGPPVPFDNLQSARRRRTSIRSLALVLILAGVGVFGWRSGSTQDLAATPTGVNEVEVDSVFGHDLGTDDVIWPAQPLPLDELLDTFTTEVLAWPSADWSDPFSVQRHGRSTFFMNGVYPSDKNRGVFIAVVESREGWTISAFAMTSDLVLEQGNLVGLRSDGWSWDPSEIANVEVYRSSSDSQYRAAHSWPPEGDVLRFSQPIGPSDVGSIMVVARNEVGEALNVSGFAVGLPDRLTIKLDSLGAGMDLNELDDEGSTRRWFVDSEIVLEAGRVHYFGEAVPGVSVALAEAAEGAGLCFQITAESSSAGSCVRSVLFNRGGAVVGLRNEESNSYTLIVIPDDIEFGDVGDAVVHSSGRFLVVVDAIFEQADYEVTDGVLNFTS